jgi:RND family efflux transporter MFP subunit
VPLASGNAPDGVLEPWKTSSVACAESGLVKSIAVKLGDRVQAGDVLATIDSSSIFFQRVIAEAQAAATGRIASARAEVELNERRVRAVETARANNFSSQLELERALADLKISQGRLAAETEEQAILRLQVDRLDEQIKQRTVVAPIDGIVVEIYKELGEYVAPNSPEVVRIVDVSRLRASFFLQLHEVHELPKNRKVTVLLGTGEESPATIEHISPVADGESGLIELRVLIDNPDSRILGSRCSLILDAHSGLAVKAPFK